MFREGMKRIQLVYKSCIYFLNLVTLSGNGNPPDNVRDF